MTVLGSAPQSIDHSLIYREMNTWQIDGSQIFRQMSEYTHLMLMLLSYYCLSKNVLLQTLTNHFYHMEIPASEFRSVGSPLLHSLSRMRT